MDLKLGGRYKMGKKLGSGAFGECYLGKYSDQTNWCLSQTLSDKVDSNHISYS